jgi:stringent starvation protein B
VLVAVAQAYPTGVPDTVREAPYVLRIGHALTPPIALEIHDGGFKALLAFNGVAHEVHVPWAAVLAAKLDVGADVAPSSKSNHLKLVP